MGGGNEHFNPRTQELDMGGSLWVHWEPGPHAEYKDSQGCYTE